MLRKPERNFKGKQLLISKIDFLVWKQICILIDSENLNSVIQSLEWVKEDEALNSFRKGLKH